MVKFSPHILIGNRKDAFNVLQGIDESVDAILDCTSDMPTAKWRKNKSVKLKKVGLDLSSISKQKVMKAVDFVSDQHRDHNVVMMVSNNNDKSLWALLAFLIFKKDMTVEDALNVIYEKSPYFVIDESFVSFIKKYEVARSDATSSAV